MFLDCVVAPPQFPSRPVDAPRQSNWGTVQERAEPRIIHVSNLKRFCLDLLKDPGKINQI